MKEFCAEKSEEELESHEWNIGKYTLNMNFISFGCYCQAYTVLNTENPNNHLFFSNASDAGIVFW